MQEEVKVADQHKRLGLPPGMDPRNLDPRRALDSAAAERVLKAQALARAQAQAASTVVIGTVVTLVSSAFGFVAALAWNDAIRSMMTDLFVKMKLNLNGTEQLLVQAISFTIIAVIAIVILQRVAGRWAKKAAIGAAAGEGSY
jgi:hypothetical protein